LQRGVLINPAESELHLASKKGQGTTLSKIIDDKNNLKKWVICGHIWENEDNILDAHPSMRNKDDGLD
jgi:hypothetical protein